MRLWGFLRDERGDLSTVLTGAFATVFLVFTAGLVANVPRVLGGQATLNALAQGAAKDISQQGCLTAQDVSDINSRLQSLNWSPSQVDLYTYVDNGSGMQSTTNTNYVAQYNQSVSVTMNYGMPAVVFAMKTPWAIPLRGEGGPDPIEYVQGGGLAAPTTCGANSLETNGVIQLGTPNAYVFNHDAFSGSAGSFGGPGTGSGGGSGSGSGSSIGSEALTATASPPSAVVGGPVQISGQVTLNGSPDPGTDVTLSSGGGPTGSAVTDSNGNYSDTLTFSAPGTYTVTVTAGAASQSVTVTVTQATVSNITVSAQSPVTDGSQETIYATVTDQNGNPVPDGTPVQVASTDSQDIPSQTLSTTSGMVALGVTWLQVGTFTVTFSSGGVSGSTNITVDPGPPATISLSVNPPTDTANPNPLTFSSGSPNLVQNGDFATGDLTNWNSSCAGSGSITVGPDSSAPSGEAVTVPSGCSGIWQHISGLVPGQTYVLSAWLDLPSGKTASLQLESGSGNGSSNYDPSPTYTPNGDGGASFAGTGSWKQYYLWTTYLAGGNGNIRVYSSDGSTNFAIDDVQMEPAWVATGNVLDAQGNPASAGTNVVLSSPTDSGDFPDQTVQTNASGTFWAPGDFGITGTQVLTATADQATASTQVTITAGAADMFQNVVLSPNPAYVGSQLFASGILEDTSGNPVPNATVTFSGAGASQDGTAVTASNGTFTVSIIPENTGTQTVTLTSGTATWSGSIDVLAASSSGYTVSGWIDSPTGANSATIQAGTTKTIGGTLLDPNGNAVPGITLTFDDQLLGTTLGTATTDANGNGSISSTFTKTGVHRILVEAEGSTGAVTVTVNPGAPSIIQNYAVSPVTLNAGQSVTATGTVEDAYGNVIPSSTVSISGDGVSTTVVTSSTGEFNGTLDLTVAGTYAITAKDQGASASQNVTVYAAAPAKLTLAVSPGSGTICTSGSCPAGSTSFTVAASGMDMDAYGNPETGHTVSLSSTCGTSSSAAVQTSGGYSGGISVTCTGAVTITATDGSASASATVSSVGCSEDSDQDACNKGTFVESETPVTFSDADGDVSCTSTSDETSCAVPSESEAGVRYFDADSDSSCVSANDDTSCTPSSESESGATYTDTDGDVSCTTANDDTSCTVPSESEAGIQYSDGDSDSSCVSASDETSCSPPAENESGTTYSDSDGDMSCTTANDESSCTVPSESEAGSAYSDGDLDATCTSASDETSCTLSELEAGTTYYDSDHDRSCTSTDDETSCTPPQDSETGVKVYDADKDSYCMTASDDFNTCTQTETEGGGMIDTGV